MNLTRLYKYRFRDIDSLKKNIVWKEISHFIFKLANNPKSVLDPAGGMCEFINNIPSESKFVIDINPDIVRKYASTGVEIIEGDALTVQIPANNFDLVFISNFLEHLHDQDSVALLLQNMFDCIKPGGLIIIMGPNFRFLFKEYFDFADHTVILTEKGVEEHIYAAGFDVVKIYTKFLPYTFKSKLPANSILTKIYLNNSLLWRFFGKQFLVIGKKPM